MPREFTSQKAIRNHAELTGYVYLWEGTHAFTTRRLLLSPDQYEIVDVRTDRGMRRAMLFPKSNPKSRVGRRRAVARRADNQARAMAAIAIGEREEWAAPQRVKPVHSGVPYVQLSRIRFPPWVSTATMCCRMRASICDTLMRR